MVARGRRVEFWGSERDWLMDTGFSFVVMRMFGNYIKVMVV
jgi:hypothetical protein